MIQAKQKAKRKASAPKARPKKRGRRAAAAAAPAEPEDEEEDAMAEVPNIPADEVQNLQPPPFPADDEQPGAADGPPGPAAGHEQLVPRGARGPLVRHAVGFLNWTDVLCTACGEVCGQIKLESLPGGRDAPVWHMRVQDDNLQWGTRQPHKKTTRTSIAGDSDQYAPNWCRTNQKSC